MMRRLAVITVVMLVGLFVPGCVAHFANAQEKPAAMEPAPTAKSTEAQTEPKPEAEKGAEHGAAATEEKKEESEDAEAALKESAMVKKVGGWLGIKDPATAYWVFTIINFAILAVAVFVPAKKALPGMFRSRGESIQKSIADARKASEAANARLSEIEGRLGRLDAEISSLRATSEQQAHAEEQRLLAATEEEKRKIIESAEQEIAAAGSAAQRELKQFVAQLAVSLAEKKITVNDATDRKLVQSFTQNLGDGAGKGRA